MQPNGESDRVSRGSVIPELVIRDSVIVDTVVVAD